MEPDDRPRNTEEPGAQPPDPVQESTLIVCSRNRPVMLQETVESVLSGDQVPTEIVIVDQSDVMSATLANFSSDRRCNVRYMWTDTIGLGRARNEGIAAATYDLIAIIDDDMFVHPDWFGSLIRTLVQRGERCVVTGQVVPVASDSDDPGSFAPSTKTDQRPAVYRGLGEEGILYSGNMAIRRSIVEAIGLFDERLGAGTSYPSSEDNDYCYRLLSGRFEIVYAPDVIVYHRAWRSERDFRRLRWAYGVGRGGYYAKHLSLRDRYMLHQMVKAVRGHLFSIPGNIRRDRQRAWGDLALTLGILFGATRWMTTTRRTR